MNQLPDDLRNECVRLMKETPDIPELTHPLINVSDVLRAHFILVHYFSDVSDNSETVETMLPGLKGGGGSLLGSALGRQIVAFDGYLKYEKPLDICSTLFFGLVKNHAFVDGNKRTALLTLLYQLQLYGLFPKVPKEDFERLVLQVADNSILPESADGKDCSDAIVEVISGRLHSMTTKKHHGSVSATMKEFCNALDRIGVRHRLNASSSRITFYYDGPATKKQTQIGSSFSGWTRSVGPGAMSNILSGLGLLNQFPDYKALLGDTEPLYILTDDFHEPLRRLKDS